MSKVALVKCSSYSYDEVKNAVEEGLSLVGGVSKFCSAGEKILLKVNLLSADPVEKCSVTNPAVLRAVGECFKAAGSVVKYGDSPAFHTTEDAAKRSGMDVAAKLAGIEMTDFKSGQEVTFPDGIQNKKFFIANSVLESDAIISVSKMKTHALARMTGAIKNQFGCIVGRRKAEFHAKMPDPISFCMMLVDLNRYLKPRLYIMDAVTAMEGNGPRNGTPRQMNLLLFSTDPVALDTVACKLMNLDPSFVPTITLGKKFGLGTCDDIEIVGQDLKRFIVTNFVVERTPVVSPHKTHPLFVFFHNSLTLRPTINKNKCVKCGVCVNACPVESKAINWINGDKTRSPRYNYNKCIRCYCCQELCPHGAITLQRPFLRKIFRNL